MTRTFYLAWRYLAYHRVKTAILVAALTITICLPLSAHLVIRHLDRAMRARAEETPLVVGARGKRFDLVLKALYFGDARVDPVSWAEYERLLAGGLADPIPLELSYTAGGFPVVGTSLDYFPLRGLTAAEGTMPLVLGQAVVGAEAAAELGVGPGDALFSDQLAYYDITRTYPLKMEVCGVLAPTRSPDDRAVFVDVKTAWIIAGLSHGHRDVTRVGDDPSVVLQRTGDEVVTNPGIFEYNEVTPETIASFHTHASADELPLSAIIVTPRDGKAATILRARYRTPESPTRMLEPAAVVDELMGRVLDVQRVFNAAFAMVAVAIVALLVLVVLLSQRLRRREMETMFKLGCPRWTALRLHAAELALVLAVSVGLSALIAAAAALAAPMLLRML